MAKSFKNDISPKVAPGKRFVFFLSLLESENSSFKGLGTAASNRLKEIDMNLQNKAQFLDEKNNKNQTMTKIEQYVKFIGNAAKVNRENEVYFLKNQLEEKIKKINNIKKKNKESNENLDKIQKEFEKLQDNAEKQFDYFKFIQILNEVMQNHNELIKNIEIQKNNMSIIQDNFNKLTNEEKQTIEKQFEQSYGQYKKEAGTKLRKSISTEKNPEEIRTIQRMLTEQRAEQIQKAVQAIGDNQNFINEIEKLYNSQTLNNTTLTEAVINILVPYILQNKEKGMAELQSMSKKDIRNLIKSLKENLNTGIAATFSSSSKNMKTLEELAMRKQNKFEQLYEAFSILDEAGQQDVLNEYDSTGKLKKILNDIRNKKKSLSYNILKQKKGEFTRLLGQEIQKKMMEKIGQSGALGKLEKEIWEKIQNEASKYYIARDLSQELYGILNAKIIKASGIAEILGQQEVQNNLVNIVFSKTPGQKINLKNDIVFSVNANHSVPKNIDLSFINSVSNELTLAYANLLPHYHELSGGETDIDKAIEGFTDNFKKPLKNLKDFYEQKLKEGKKEQEILDEIEPIFLSGISVKEYSLYENSFGYHGGSLGGGGTPDTVLYNITKMYEQGGIDVIDYNRLLFAALNCGDTTVGPTTLQKSLEDYLLGGAALLMFDEGFINTNTEKFLKEMGGEIANQKIKTFNLYRLNGIYIPASYILETIYQNLLQTYNFLESITLPTLIKNSNNKVVITPHKLTEKDIRYNKEEKKGGKTKIVQLETSLSRWNDMAERANENTKIQFLFMAGMLDIFEQLHEAFNPQNIK